MKILAVDDEPQILRTLRTSLAARGHDVVTAPNGETALDLLASNDVDLVLLDLGLPGIDGVEVLRRLRPWSEVPVIVLSVREGQRDKVEALDAGADDYVTKPFGMDELLARIRAVLRRRSVTEAEPPVIQVGDVVVDLPRRQVSLAGEPVHLTPTEFAILEQLATHQGKLLTHRWLLQKVWGHSYGQESNYLRVHVANLRRKLGDRPGPEALIVTEPGVGYRWIASEGTAGIGS